MEKDKFQITMPELQKLIKEEYANMVKDASRAEEIQERLKAINEELKTIPETISEVETTGTKKVKSTGWTGAGEGDVKYGEKFEKIGTHLKEDEEIEGEIEVGSEIEGEMEDEMEIGIEAPKMGHFEMKFAELGRELDSKVGENIEQTEDSEEIESMEDVEDSEEVESMEDIDSDESFEESVSEEVDVEEKVVAEEQINEDLEEPIDGETPAQDSDARFNDYMDKDKHVNENKNISGKGILSEGFTSEKKTALNSELERMKKLAKI